MGAEYAKGYAAGRKRKIKDLQAVDVRKRNDAFWQRAFLAVLPAVVGVSGWTRGKSEILNLEDRVRLAKDFADTALIVAQTHV